MGALGGALGVALGWTIGRLINIGTNIYLKRQDLAPEQIWFVPWWLVGSAIAFAVIVSLVSGLYPAARAARFGPGAGTPLRMTASAEPRRSSNFSGVGKPTTHTEYDTFVISRNLRQCSQLEKPVRTCFPDA